ncbi:MAG: hypothetical protein KGM16_07030 [Bacteroidota bacterium]|nr:hypothetical protein [Bacteroidota bacterium]
MTSEGGKLIICLFTVAVITGNDDGKWLMVKPTQHEHLQKGEHTLLIGLSC